MCLELKWSLRLCSFTKPCLWFQVFTIFLILYSIVAIPFILAFDPPSARPESEGALYWINRGIDGTFMVDVVLNFITAVDDDSGEVSVLITNLSEIRKRYARGWFVIDVFSCFPIDMVMDDDGVKSLQMVKSLKFFRLLKVFRLFRVLRIQRILSRLQHAFVVRHHVRHLVSDAAIILLLAHWCTCGFYGAGAASCTNLGSGDNIEDMDCERSWIHSAGITDSPIGRKYVATLYWTTTAITTVGFGDIAPSSGSEQLVAMIVMIIGACMTAFGVSHVVQLTDEMSADARTFRIKLDRMNMYMEQVKLPNTLRVEVREFLNQVSKKMKQRMLQREEGNLLSDLSVGLRAKLAHAINQHYVLQVPFFREIATTNAEFVSVLCMNMSSVYVSSGEDIVREGEWGDSMYFIVAGNVAIIMKEKSKVERDVDAIGECLVEPSTPDTPIDKISENVDEFKYVEKRLALLGDNDFFGERAVFAERQRRTATCRSVAFTEMRTLPRDAFIAASKDFPEIQSKIHALSEERLSARIRERSLQSDSQLNALAAMAADGKAKFEALTMKRRSDPPLPPKRIAPLTRAASDLHGQRQKMISMKAIAHVTRQASRLSQQLSGSTKANSASEEQKDDVANESKDEQDDGPSNAMKDLMSTTGLLETKPSGRQAKTTNLREAQELPVQAIPAFGGGVRQASSGRASDEAGTETTSFQIESRSPTNVHILPAPTASSRFASNTTTSRSQSFAAHDSGAIDAISDQLRSHGTLLEVRD